MDGRKYGRNQSRCPEKMLGVLRFHSSRLRSLNEFSNQFDWIDTISEIPDP